MVISQEHKVAALAISDHGRIESRTRGLENSDVAKSGSPGVVRLFGMNFWVCLLYQIELIMEIPTLLPVFHGKWSEESQEVEL